MKWYVNSGKYIKRKPDQVKHAKNNNYMIEHVLEEPIVIIVIIVIIISNNSKNSNNSPYRKVTLPTDGESAVSPAMSPSGAGRESRRLARRLRVIAALSCDIHTHAHAQDSL